MVSWASPIHIDASECCNSIKNQSILKSGPESQINELLLVNIWCSVDDIWLQAEYLYLIITNRLPYPAPAIHTYHKSAIYDRVIERKE